MKKVNLSNFIRENHPASAKSMSQRSLVFGFGINDSDYTTRPLIDSATVRCPAYSCWSNMLTRCLCEKYKKNQPTYRDALVCDEWRSFMAFRSWWIENHTDGWELDKDLLIVGNKVYSPSTCIFVPCWINTLTVDCRSARGDHPIGAYFCKDKNKFSAKCRHPISGKVEFLGYFYDASSASAAWRSRKLKIADSLAKDMNEIHELIYPNTISIIKSAI